MFRFAIRDMLWLMVVVAVALAVYSVKLRRLRWEYKEKLVGSGSTFNLTIEGNDGWELVDVEREPGTHTYYFKRAK